MDLKELKRIAAACRKVGISHFKSSEYEFTLTEEAPRQSRKPTKGRDKLPESPSNTPFESDTPSMDDLLYWSSDNFTTPLTEPDNE